MPFIRITTFGVTLTSEQIYRLQQGTTELMVTAMRKPLVASVAPTYGRVGSAA